jgi:TonB family protein
VALLANDHECRRNSRSVAGVTDGMKPIQRYCLLPLLMGLLSVANTSSAVGPCTYDGPLLTRKDGTPIWLDTDALLKSATHCVAPQMPDMARQVRIEGQVLVDILVDEKGKVACAKVIVGHPLLTGSALEAAKDWTFRQRKQSGKPVSFYGHLRFHFSTGGAGKSEDPCTVAHW